MVLDDALNAARSGPNGGPGSGLHGRGVYREECQVPSIRRSSSRSRAWNAALNPHYRG